MTINKKIIEDWSPKNIADIMPQEDDFTFLMKCMDEYNAKGLEAEIQCTPIGLKLCLYDNIYLLVRAVLTLSLLVQKYGETCIAFRKELIDCLQTNIDKADMQEIIKNFQVEYGKYSSIYNKYTSLPKATESLQEMLNEAGSLTNEEKMDLWHQGKRGFNLKAAGDDKLFDNYNICINKHYDNEADLLALEAEYRGLWWGKNHRANKIYQQGQAQKAAATSSPQGQAIPISAAMSDVFTLELLDFNKDEFLACKKAIDSNKSPTDFYTELKNEIENEDPDGYKIAYGNLTTARQTKILTNLIYSSILKDKNYIDTLKRVANLRIPGINIAKSCKVAIANPTILNALTAWYNEINNGKLTEDIEKHERLNPKLWDNEELKPEVAEKINLIVDEFISRLKEDNIEIDVKDIIIVGSNCSYNYTKDSDLDLHIVVDTTNLENSDLYNKLYSAYRTIFNKKIDVEFYGIPVEIFVETDDMPKLYNGVYSVMNNAWIEKPVAEDIPEIDQEAFDKEFAVWEERYKNLLASIETELDEALAQGDEEMAKNIQAHIDWLEDKEDSDYYNQNKYDDEIEELNQRLQEDLSNNIINEINQYIEDLYDLRKTGLAEEGQYGIKNLVFKEIRNKGYLDELKDLKNELLSKELSLKEADILFDKADFNTNEATESEQKEPDMIQENTQNGAKIEKLIEAIAGIHTSFVDDSGLFKIYKVKESLAPGIINKLYNLPKIDWVKKESNGNNFNKTLLLGNVQPEEKTYTIVGKFED